MDNNYPYQPQQASNNKKKRTLIVVGVIVGLFILLVIAGGISGSAMKEEQTALFTANKEQVLGDFRKALDADDLATASEIKNQYDMVDDYKLKAMISEYKAKISASVEADNAKSGSSSNTEYINFNESFRSKVLSTKVLKVELKDRVGGAILGEKSNEGSLYVVVFYEYKNISKKPVRESPLIELKSPNGALYSADISASAWAASAYDGYDEELFSELQPDVFSRGVEAFKVPRSFGKTGDWKIAITVNDGGMFGNSTTRYIKVGVK